VPIPLLATAIVLGFALGSIPSGLWIGRARGVDLRTLGSRNIGATNAFRVLGARWGGLVFLLDVAKGWLAAFAPRVLHGTAVPPESSGPLLAAMVAGGLAAILGHVFSPWVGFRGGRGVATSLGFFLGIAPLPTLVAFVIWIALVAASRRVSVGSLGAATVYPILVFFMERGNPHRIALFVVSALVALLVIIRHRANIQRILAGTEPPIVGGGAGGTP